MIGNSMYTFGGGFPSQFAMGGQGYQTWQMGRKGPELNPVLQGRINPITGRREGGLEVVPAGAAGKTPEMMAKQRDLRNQGIAFVEAPEEYRMGGRELDIYGRTKDPTGMYNVRTGQKFSGTRTFQVGGNLSGKPENKPESGITSQTVTQSPSLTQTTELRETMLGQGGEPMAFTGFGQMAREQRASEFQTPVGRGMTGIEATIGVPRFPFAGAESSFKPAIQSSTFGGLPTFAQSGFGGPQPAQTMGPVDTQPRRPWMY
jgi:hypothetical protein